MVYQCEKMMNEDGDKFPAEDKAVLSEKVDALKEALKGEDVNLIKSRQEELTQKFYEVSEKIYKAAQAAQGGAQQGGAQGFDPNAAAGGGYQDADFTDIPEDQ